MPTGTLVTEEVERYLYWIQERHTIHTLKELGFSKPWSFDPIFQEWFFTNPYRENDKTTQWFRDNLREPLRDSDDVAFATIAFRWFNYIPTAHILCGLPGPGPSSPPKKQNANFTLKYGNPTPGATGKNYFLHWDRGAVNRIITRIADKGEKVFTGAYMIKLLNATPKVDAVCQMIDNVWQDRKHLVKYLHNCDTLQKAWKFLCKYPFIAGFNAYEIVTDLRHTHFLENAKDINTWSNLGPGGSRGLYRICGLHPTRKPWLDNWQPLMVELLGIANKRFAKPVEVIAQYVNGQDTTRRLDSPPKNAKGVPLTLTQLRKGYTTEYGIEYLQSVGFPKLELREIEHSLCEYDKYCRADDIAKGIVRSGKDDSSSKMKRKYKGR